jgi:hypothetical protein
MGEYYSSIPIIGATSTYISLYLFNNINFSNDFNLPFCVNLSSSIEFFKSANLSSSVNFFSSVSSGEKACYWH